MVQHKRTQSRWAAKASPGTNNTYSAKEFAKPGLQRTYSQDTDLSDTGNYSHSSSGDESWSEIPSLANSPAGGTTKLSGEAELFVPQQPTQVPGKQRTRLSSGASVFVPGQMASQQMAPMPMQPTPAFIGMPQMMPMDQANVMPYMSPYYMGPDGCYYMAVDGVCPVAMPVISGTAPLPPSSGAPEASKEPAPPLPLRECSVLKDPSPKAAPNASGKSRWADLNDDDDADDPWLQ
eukprot:gnl/MRDRNA2_/MRDRNA2_93859_c0_seq1.p1 gnl/MRDRNA2_/MRDRNA2_93859_c0~~gnl/MRDRNA2_/MRDRNA2_93859_c0_seq1.p1  ORF type:complete len:235 (-),score=50.49 gnl/MRDRNA2_/MRDRNA2_93859_c0_seq1:168-872(-)